MMTDRVTIERKIITKRPSIERCCINCEEFDRRSSMCKRKRQNIPEPELTSCRHPVPMPLEEAETNG